MQQPGKFFEVPFVPESNGRPAFARARAAQLRRQLKEFERHFLGPGREQVGRHLPKMASDAPHCSGHHELECAPSVLAGNQNTYCQQRPQFFVRCLHVHIGPGVGKVDLRY